MFYLHCLTTPPLPDSNDGHTAHHFPTSENGTSFPLPFARFFFFFFLMSMHQGDVTMDEKRNMGYMSQLDVVYPACRGVAQGKSNG
jgi:hypothetical protein